MVRVATVDFADGADCMNSLLETTTDSLPLLPYFLGYFLLGVVLLLLFWRI